MLSVRLPARRRLGCASSSWNGPSCCKHFGPTAQRLRLRAAPERQRSARCFPCGVGSSVRHRHRMIAGGARAHRPELSRVKDRSRRGPLANTALPHSRLLGAVPTLWPFLLQLAGGSVSYATSLGLALEVTLAKRNLSKRKHCALTFDSLMLVNG